MPIINNTCKQTQAQCRINQLTSGCDSETVLTRTVIANQYGEDRISAYVDNPNQLPDIYNNSIPSGTLIFVNSLNVPVIASDFQWIGLDGRLLRSDIPGTQIWAWGGGQQGQLGNGTTAFNRCSPVTVVGSITDWCQVSAGGSHGLGLQTNGTMWSWGYAGQGRLGDGTVFARCSPVSVIGSIADWCAVSAGTNHTLAIRVNGTAWSWGLNYCGVLGDGTTTNRSSPVAVVGGINWCAIAAGQHHNLALRTDGTAWSWGRGGQGQLGNGTATDRSSPVSVIGGIADWCTIDASWGFHSLAIRTNGTAWAWGQNNVGHLGDGTATVRSSPVSVIGSITNWSAISAGYRHSLGLRTDGTVWSWGFNNYGQLGDGTVTARSSPVSVIGGFVNWCRISAGECHNAAIRTDGTLWSWGLSGVTGRLGDGTVTNRSSPVSVIGGFTDWSAISAGGTLNLAIKFL